MFIWGSVILLIILFWVISAEKKENERSEAVVNGILAELGYIEIIGNSIVTRIIDGDTIEIDGRERIRLANVDAYESNSPIHPEIMAYMNRHVLGQKVYVDRKETDKYGRTVASITLPCGTPLSVELVKRGYGQIYEKYADKATDEYIALKRVEQYAMVNKVGGYGMLLLPPWLDRNG